ncbi:TPA: hypothetical protein ACS705_003588 [Providencia alcalifaciens]
MIYQTGTITTTAGQTKIKGTGTRWKDNLAGISEGCPISYLIDNTVFMNTVLSVNSDTEINLTYPVPVAATAAKYQIATFVLDSMSDGVRKMLANQQYIQYFLRNMDTWMTQDGIVEIKTPTGETVKLESIIALKKLIDGKLSLTGGVINKDGEALAIKNANEKQALYYALRGKDNLLRGFIGCPSDTDRIALVNSKTNKALTLTEAGAITYDGKNIVLVGDYGVGATYTQQLIKITDYSSAVNQTLGFIYNDSGAIQAPSAWGGGIRFGRDPKASSSILYSPDWSTRLFLSAGLANGKMSDWVEFYSTGNTTVDTQGNIKKASPVIKLFADSIDSNEEAEGVEMEHLGVGHYLIKGVIGFNADGAWGINNGFVIPQDHNGKNMVLIDYEVRPDGDIEVFVFHQENAEMPERFQNKRIKHFDEDGNPVYFENYEPCDIPEARWIDMRVEMPPNSIYNQNLAEAERLAKIEAEKAAREEAERLEEESKQEQASKLEE